MAPRDYIDAIGSMNDNLYSLAEPSPTRAHGKQMAEKRQKRQTEEDDPDWVPGVQKKRQKASTTRSAHAASSRQPRRLDSKTRILHVLDNVPHETIIDKLKTALLTDTCEGLVASLSAVFDEAAFPPPGKKIHCTDCGELFDANYNQSSSCRVLHNITCAWRSGNEKGYECERCEERWTREWDDVVTEDDVDEIGYCFEGCHSAELKK